MQAGKAVGDGEPPGFLKHSDFVYYVCRMIAHEGQQGRKIKIEISSHPAGKKEKAYVFALADQGDNNQKNNAFFAQE
jgi:hypothetical protein